MATPRHPFLGHLTRSLLLVVGTAAVLVGGFALMSLELLWMPLRMLLVPLVILLYFALPLLAVPLHYHWQKPAESSVVLAFVTGLGAWLLALAGAAWISLRTVGC
ncbi:MAG: hypothetical protein H6838_09085 [Planctomycetes bacterium]|nr:hypothetical protein [Planctomycetota bacterium]